MTDDPHSAANPLRIALSRLAHAAPWVYALVCTAVIVRNATSTAVPDSSFWAIMSMVELTALIVTSIGYGIHAALPCALCAAAAPPDSDGVAAARERHVQLRLHHAEGLRACLAALLVCALVFGQLVVGEQAGLILMGGLGIALAITWYSSITHKVLSSWCPECDHGTEHAGQSVA